MLSDSFILKSPRSRVVIVGAADRGFHTFNMVYRDNPNVEVVAFVGSQASELIDRYYPTALAGFLYPEGIPIVDEAKLESICHRETVDQVIFADSNIPYSQVMHLASRVLAAGADFSLLGSDCTMLHTKVPVIAVSAVQTGRRTAQTIGWMSRLLRQWGLRVGVIHHPQASSNLEQSVQRFATPADLDLQNCTLEERQEYEPHLKAGTFVYTGIDYARIVHLAEQESDLILWEGGNNDFPFVHPHLHIVLVDSLRSDQATIPYPGESVLRVADIVVVGGGKTAANIQQMTAAVRKINSTAMLLTASCSRENPAMSQDRRFVAEDQRTYAHTAGHPDPRALIQRDMAAVYAQYPYSQSVLPTKCSAERIETWRQRINRSPDEVIVTADAIDLSALMEVNQPIAQPPDEFAEASQPELANQVQNFLMSSGLLGTTEKPIVRSR
jgi:predicted GTPase